MASQKARLQNTAAGRAILHRTGTATELRALDGRRSLPSEVRNQITANLMPKHMSHELHEGRRKARVDRQRRQLMGDLYVTYVDVAAYPAGGLFAVAAVNGRDNSLTLAASVRAETLAAAETIVAALVINQHDRVQPHYKKLQASVTLLCESVNRWIESNVGLEPTELHQRLERLVDEAVKEHEVLVALEDEDDAEADSDAGERVRTWQEVEEVEEEGEEGPGQRCEENYLRRAAIDSWLENNQESEPAVLRQRLENLFGEVVARKEKFTVNEEDVGDVNGDVSEYGLGKKLKKWKNKVKKVLGDAAKAVIVNKVVGSLG
ncbi:hypothetical protein HPB49_006575 [Dermacentor silvarum]|uniref:Uncharacterized protein n=1 Tax=Dermacentor silvarum TaxID=543639 RepID=A0ACB8DB76_DERSI|nr:hypothetical protein HPB49_006575 [Dermacentor silvarum]